MSESRFTRFLVVVLMVLLGGLIAALPAKSAAPICGPRDNPVSCTPVFNGTQQLAIKSGVPFVWLRQEPKSSGAVAYTVNNTANARFTIDYSPSVYDGYQNWWLVKSVSDKSKGGWVEQASLVAANTAPDTGGKANFKTPFAGSINAGLPFVWIRNAPRSNGGIVGIILPRATITVLGQPQPVNDGVQWWWYITVGTQRGYIEQSAIVAAGSTPATSVPPTLPPNAPPHANWKVSFAGGVKSGVPYISVRANASSSAGVFFNLYPGDPFIVDTNEAPAYDGVQWWWRVDSPVPTFPRSGWVEEASIVERVDNFPTPTSNPNAAAPTCGTMTVTPTTSHSTGTADGGGDVYFVTHGSTITFRVEGLANLASITLNVPGPNETLWRSVVPSRKLDFPGAKVEVTAVVPQAYGYVNVWTDAVGLNGQTIHCGGFWVDNGTGTSQIIGQAVDPNVPAVTPDLSGQ